MNKKALLVGSSFSAAPIFFALKKRGIHVSVCGNREADPCRQYSDNSFLMDYSNRDELLHLVETEKFDYLVPTCNDYSYRSCAWTAQRLGFPGFDSYNVAATLHTKNEFRRLTEQFSLPAPKSRRQKAGQTIDTSSLQYPLLVKPVDSFSGRGVTKVMVESDLPPAVEAALQSCRGNEAVLEEFVDGNLHSHSAFISNKEVVFDVFVDEYCTVYPYQVDCSNHPSLLPAAVQDAVRQSVVRLVKILGLTDGLLHTQFIADGERFWIIKCRRRSPGDLSGPLGKLSTAIQYTDLYIRPFLGEPISPSPGFQEAKCCGRHTISIDQSLVSYAFSHNIP